MENKVDVEEWRMWAEDPKNVLLDELLWDNGYAKWLIRNYRKERAVVKSLNEKYLCGTMMYQVGNSGFFMEVGVSGEWILHNEDFDYESSRKNYNLG